MTEQRTLHLTLSKEPFEVMLTGEKDLEFRKPSDWIKSRLFNKDGSQKDYDFIKFTNGYGKGKPFFMTKYNGFCQLNNPFLTNTVHTYSNGLAVKVERYDFVLYLGDILKKGNIKT